MVIIAYVLIALGGLMSLLNWSTVVASWRSKRFVSAVPLVGGCRSQDNPGRIHISGVEHLGRS
jgi:hypothetical protein